MANIMSQRDVKNHVHRNGFDLSFRNAFTAKVGQIVPVFCKEVLPGDKWSIDINSFTRTQPVQTAAFTRIQEFYDFYFVPTSLLWDKFNDFIVQTNNYSHASSINGSVTDLDTHPYISVRELILYLHALQEAENEGHGTAKDFFGFSRYENTIRLLDYLGYGDLRELSQYNSYYDFENFALNPFPLAAYQKVCQDFFRYTQWETSKPQRYNFDYMFRKNQMKVDVGTLQNQVSSVLTYESPLYNIFDLNYCNYKKDLVMGLLPRAQFGDTAIAAPLKGFQRMEFAGINTVSPTGDLSQGFIANVASNQGSSATDLVGRSGLGVSVFALRFAEATQRWREITQSGSLDFKAQLEKHWNVETTIDESYLCQWLGGTSGNIAINEVENTNLAADTSQAVLAGKGVTSISRNGVVNFSSRKYGYIIGVYHAVPVLDWNSAGIDRSMLRVKATDYAIPEYDNLGMEEVPLAIVDITRGIQNYGDPFGSIGFAPRYWDYKTSRDIVRGSFLTSMKDWVAPINNNFVLFPGEKSYNMDWRSFKVAPQSVDSIFPVSSQVTSSVDSDQLLIASFFDTKVVRNLSVSGLPF